MKVSDYKIYEEYFKNNPESQEAPDDILEKNAPKEEPKDEPELTLKDVINELSLLKDQIKTIQTKPEPSEDKTKSENAEKLDALTEEVKKIKEEAQKKAIDDSELPKEQTADDVIRNFIMGGK